MEKSLLSSKPEHPYENLVIGQRELADVILQHLERSRNSEAFWQHRVVAVDQSIEDEVTATTESPDGSRKEFTASYVVGVDSGKSSIQRLLNIEFKGFI